MIGFQWRLILALTIFSLTVAATGQVKPSIPQRMFNQQAFVGLISDVPPAVYATAKLDYELDGADGVMHFSSCREIENTDGKAIIESQYGLFRLLTMNCLALRRHTEGLEATRSYFPLQLSGSFVATLPATVTVDIGGQNIESKAETPLRAAQKGWRASRAPHGGIKIITEGDERTYLIMSRADFDRDGNEDLLIRIDWAARNGSGRAFDLVQLSKTSASGPILVSWRAH